MFILTKINLKNYEFISNSYEDCNEVYDILIDYIHDFCLVNYSSSVRLDSNFDDTIYQINSDAYLQVKTKDNEETYILLHHKVVTRGFLFNTYNYAPIYIFHLKHIYNGGSVTTLEYV
jgi:hypothetical protein